MQVCQRGKGDAPGRGTGRGEVLIWGLHGDYARMELWIVNILCIVGVRRGDDLEGAGKVGISSGESDGSRCDKEWIIVDIKVHLENSRFVMQA